MPKIGKIIIQWDVAEIISSWIESQKIDNPDATKTDDELWQEISEDQYLFDMLLDTLYHTLTERMKRNTHGGWIATVSCFGWRGQNGYKTFHATTGKELLKAILPNCDCTFKVFRYGHGFAIQNFHHDSPTGKEWYYISPCKEQEWDKRIEEYLKQAA